MRIGLIAVLLAAMAGTVSAAQAQSPQIIFYGDINFRGDSRSVGGDVQDFRSIGFNDVVSSIRVLSGVWEVCEDANFGGRCLTLRADDPTLVPDGLNDRISSVRLVSAGGGFGGGRDGGNRGRGYGRQSDNGRGGAVTLFSDIGFGGDSRDMSGDVTDFSQLGFNDAVSSIRIRSGTWLFCEDAGFRGRCMTFDRDVPTLVDLGFNDRISSMRRVR